MKNIKKFEQFDIDNIDAEEVGKYVRDEDDIDIVFTGNELLEAIESVSRLDGKRRFNSSECQNFIEEILNYLGIETNNDE